MLRSLARAFLRRTGYQLLGPLSAYAGERSLAALMQREGINVVLDVGANTGQFGAELRAAGYRGRIISFEPQSGAHAELSARASGDALWTVAERTAVGAESGRLTMHLSANSVSSSALGMLPEHESAEPASAYVGTEDVAVERLDALWSAAAGDRVLLKADVQGYEPQVLDGATAVLPACRAVLLEMSLRPLYAGQVLAPAMWDRMEREGYTAWSVEPGFREPQTQRMLQVDGVFVRETE